MSSLVASINSSIGKKFIMALTGLGLAGFVLIHMTGNLQLIFGTPEGFNEYGHKLTSMPIYPLISWGLMLCAVLHAYMGMLLSKENSEARGDKGYSMPALAAGKDTDPASKSMMFSGSIILIFLISHLVTFKYGTNYPVVYNGVEMRDLHRLVIEKFHYIPYVVGYIVSLFLLGVHLSHGVSSIFQSLGLRHPKYQPAVHGIGIAYAVIVSLGFIAQPLYVYFLYRG